VRGAEEGGDALVYMFKVTVSYHISSSVNRLIKFAAVQHESQETCLRRLPYHMYICIYICICVYTYICVYTCIYICTIHNIHVYIYIEIYIYLNVYV